jgi:outer membrane receptor protein involved in Fe transport
MIMTLRHALLATSAVSMLSFALADMARAQNLAIEEIVVSARKREESLQEVPLAISAFSSENLKELDIRGVYELQNFTPNFSFDKSFGRRFDRPIIRGQSSVQASDVLASFFVDGVYISGSISTVSTDALERIEVLRGPQSALYGRGAFAGAINYVTKGPSDEFEGQVNTRVGSHDDYKGAIWMRGPIVEGKLQYFLSGNWEYYGGQYRNTYAGNTGRSSGPENNFVSVPTRADNSRLGKEETRDTTAKLRFIPTENFEINVKGSYAKSYDSQFASVFIPASQNNCFRPGIDPGVPNTARGYRCGELEIGNLRPNVNLPSVRDGVVLSAVQSNPLLPNFGRILRYDPVALNNFFTALDAARRDPNVLTPAQPGALAFTSPAFATGVPLNIVGAGAKPGQYRTVGMYIADMQYDYQDWNILAQGTYNTDKATFNIDADRFPQLNPTSSTTTTIETSAGSQSIEINYDYSGEFRVTSPQQERLRGLAGIYYYNRKSKTRGRTLGGNQVTGAFFFEDGRDFNRQFIKYKAAFAQAEYDITDDLTLGVEARYAQDKRGIPVTPFNAQTSRPVRSSSKTFTPRVSLDYKVNDDVLLYASFAEGVLPGGFNQALFARNAVIDTDFARLESQGKTQFDPEKNLVYELGVKSTLMDGRLVFNGDVYYIDWTAQKLNNTEPVLAPNFNVANPQDPATALRVNANIQTNSGASRVQGIEFNTTLLVTEQLTLSAAYGMADHVFKKANDLQIEQFTGVLQDLTLANGGNAKGKHSINAPKHTATASAAYKDDLSADARWFVRADMTYRTKLWTEVHNVSHTGDRWGLNSRLGVETDSWRVDLYVNNILNDKTPGSVFRGADGSALRYTANPAQAPNALELSLPRGREFGVTGQYSF